MNSNESLLNAIYQNAQTGATSIHSVLPKVHSQPLKDELYRQKSDYEYYAQKAKEQLKNGQLHPKEKLANKITIPIGIAMNTMMNQSASHIAELMINGSTMGIIEITKELKRQPEKNAAESLGQELLRFEKQNIENLKGYLK